VVPAQHDQKDIVQEILSVEAWAGQPASPAFDLRGVAIVDLGQGICEPIPTESKDSSGVRQMAAACA